MKRVISLFKETWTEFSDDKAQRLGAALAYYTIFSLGPILLVWIYWSAQILFFGAEFTQVYARRRGSRIGAQRAERGAQEKVVVSRPAPAYAKVKSSNGAGKLAIGGVAGLFLGALVGGVSALILVAKSAKKLITLH